MGNTKKTNFSQILTLSVFILLTVFFFISCEQPSNIEAIKTGNCIITIQEEKSLVSEVNTTITEYLYKATPQFSGTATGTASEWSHLSYGGQGTVGLLTQGKWKFDVKGLNSSGTIITTGSAVGYIDPGKDNIIEVQMNTDPSIGKGTVSFAIWTQNVSENETIMKVYHREKNASSWITAAEYSEAAQKEPNRWKLPDIQKLFVK